jgi:hypothetical protein
MRRQLILAAPLAWVANKWMADKVVDLGIGMLAGRLTPLFVYDD